MVGWSNIKNGNPHAFRYSGGVMTDLKTLIGNPTIGDNSSYAYAINDAGQIVGSSLYDSGLYRDLPRHPLAERQD